MPTNDAYVGMVSLDDDEECTEGGDEECDSDDESRNCVWTISPTESAYDDGMLRIVTVAQNQGKQTWFQFGCNVSSLTMLLLFNATLQLVVVTRVSSLVTITRSERQGLVFAPTGSCGEQPASVYAGLHISAVKQATNWDCSAAFPTAMSNTSWLDANNDGFWSAEDNLEAQGAGVRKALSKGGNLTNIFWEFMKEAEQGQFRSQSGSWVPGHGGIGEAATPQLAIYDKANGETAQFTKIPMAWMREEEPVIQLCNNFDPHLCGNLELRGILKVNIPDLTLTPDERISECRSIVDRCVNKFGELYRSYAMTAAQSCGGRESTWAESALVIVNRYEKADKYDPHVNKQAIPTITYETFLLLVLIIWWLIVIGELRLVLSWWVVIWCIPSDKTLVTGDVPDENIEIKSISEKHKALILVMVLLPRTIIIVMLSYIGTDFLIIADSYSDLILNSVALGFLIEVDEMLFGAVTSQRSKDKLASMLPVKAAHSCCNWCIALGQFPTSIPLVIFVVSMAIAQMTKSYTMVHGKMDLSGAYGCLCHMEGARCAAAQILGGLARVPVGLV